MACRHPYLQHMGSVVVACGLQSTGLIGVVQRLSQSRACEIFMDQGSNPCLLHRQADSLPLNHKGSPRHLHFKSCDVLNITLICSMLAAFCFLMCQNLSLLLYRCHVCTIFYRLYREYWSYTQESRRGLLALESQLCHFLIVWQWPVT